jgi:hypothetical protein
VFAEKMMNEKKEEEEKKDKRNKFKTDGLVIHIDAIVLDWITSV